MKKILRDVWTELEDVSLGPCGERLRGFSGFVHEVGG
jgi:hypothetical protein